MRVGTRFCMCWANSCVRVHVHARGNALLTNQAGLSPRPDPCARVRTGGSGLMHRLVFLRLSTVQTRGPVNCDTPALSWAKPAALRTATPLPQSTPAVLAPLPAGPAPVGSAPPITVTLCVSAAQLSPTPCSRGPARPRHRPHVPSNDFPWSTHQSLLTNWASSMALGKGA